MRARSGVDRISWHGEQHEIALEVAHCADSEAGADRFDAIEAPPEDIRDDQVVRALIPLLDDPDMMIRLCTVETLGLYPDPDALYAIRLFVGREQDPLARAYGFSSLGLIGEVADLQALVDASSSDQHPQVRVHAYRGLFDLVRRTAKEALVSLLPHDDVQRVAVRTLGEVLSPRSDEDVVLALEAQLERESNPASRNEINALIEDLRESSEMAARSRAASGARGTASSSKSLLTGLTALNSDHGEDRLAAIAEPPSDIPDHVAVAAEPNAVHALRLFVRRAQDPLARADGLSSLGLIGEAEDTQLLVETLSRDPHPQVRVHAYRGLFELVRRTAKEALLSLVAVEDVQRVAVQTLGEVLLPRSDEDVVLALEAHAERATFPAQRADLDELIESLRDDE